MLIRYCLLKYDTVPDNDFVNFINEVPKILKTLETKYKITYGQGCIKCSDLHIILIPSKIINKITKDGELIDLSCTFLPSNIIMISYENWMNKCLNNDDKLYKKYVILHEFMHAYPFYLEHVEESCHKNGGFNVMFQQTRNSFEKNKNLKLICNPEIVLPEIELSHKKLKNDFDKLKSQRLTAKKEIFKQFTFSKRILKGLKHIVICLKLLS